MCRMQKACLFSGSRGLARKAISARKSRRSEAFRACAPMAATRLVRLSISTKLLAIFDAHPEYAVDGRFVVRINAARVRLFELGEAYAAAALLQAVVTEDVDVSGENLYIARAHEYLAEALIETGQHAQAAIHLQKADELFARYGGQPVGGGWSTQLARAWSAIEQADNEAADALLQLAENELRAEPPSASARQRLALMRLYHRAYRGGSPSDLTDAAPPHIGGGGALR